MGTQPFLTIMTRTHKRPAQLAVCSASIAGQSRPELLEHVILRDEVGLGVGEANTLYYTADAAGQYVWQLDDDDVMASEVGAAELYEELFTVIEGRPRPPYFFVKFDHGGVIRPKEDVWGLRRPLLNEIGGSSIITRNDVWMRYRECWGLWYAGDYDFIFEVMCGEGEPVWLDVVLGKTQNGRSRGRMETENG